MHFILTVKGKNAVNRLRLLTMIVPVFTKGRILKGFSFTTLLPHPTINPSVTQGTPRRQQETFEYNMLLHWHIKLKVWVHNHTERLDENV